MNTYEIDFVKATSSDFTSTAPKQDAYVYSVTAKDEKGNTHTEVAYVVIDDKAYAPCRRCEATGRYLWNGTHDICYACNGTLFTKQISTKGGKWESFTETPEAYIEKAQERCDETLIRIRNIQITNALRWEGINSWRDAHKDEIEMIVKERYCGRDFIEYGALTVNAYINGAEIDTPSENYIKALVKAIDEMHNPAPVECPVPEGKETVTGKIISIKDTYTDYGYTAKMLVEDDRGFRVYGTLPRSIEDADKGDRVSFTATLTRSQKDAGFGFFQRPTRAKMMA